MIVNASGLITDVLATRIQEPVPKSQLVQLVRHLIAQTRMIVNASGLITDVLATLIQEPVPKSQLKLFVKASNCPDQDDRQCIWIHNGCTCNTDPRTCSEISTQATCQSISLPRPG